MDEKIRNIIPTIFEEMQSDRENESKRLLWFYVRCNAQEKSVIDNVMMYLCGWTFPTLLEKCGIAFDGNGNPVAA